MVIKIFLVQEGLSMHQTDLSDNHLQELVAYMYHSVDRLELVTYI